MRICLLTYRGNPFCGGQGVYAMALGQALARRGHDVHCVTGPPYPPETPGVRWHRVPGLAALTGNGNGAAAGLGGLSPLGLYERTAYALGVFPEMAAFSLRAFDAVRSLLRNGSFDVIHDNQTLGWGLLALRHLGVPLVATIHHPLTVDRQRGFDPPSGFRERLSKVMFHPVLMQGFVARRMTHIVTVSRAARERIETDFRVPPGRVQVVPNGVDTELFTPRPEVARVPGRVLYVGNLEDPNKGGRYLLAAAARLRPEAHLVIATGGAAVGAWAVRLMDELNLRGRVTFRFGVPGAALARLYNSAEVAVCSSLFEGFGLPAAEAMASGLPLVSTRGGALEEVVGTAGVLVPVADSEALAGAINALLADPRRRAALGREARARVLECFQWDRAARDVEQVYREAIAAFRGAGR
jgi:glycosyltransferase involved in cell wall biosynthesis